MEKPHAHIPWITLLVLCSLFLIFFLLPAFLQNGIILGHDAFIHTVYIHQFTLAFLQGEFPVRVIDWFYPGANVPVFNFYQPGFYYFILVIKLLGFSYSTALNSGLLLLWILSGIGMYLFVKNRFGSLAGLLSAFLFVFAPYHIVEVFVRAAFPEFLALTCIPWIFWALDSFAKKGTQRYLFLSTILTGIIAISNSPTVLIFYPMIGIFCILLFFEKKSISLFVWLFTSLGLGFLLSTFFMLPAFAEQHLVHINLAPKDRLFNFNNHFVCLGQFFSTNWGYGLSVPGCNDTMSFQVGIVHWIAVIGAGISVVISILSKKIKKTDLLFAAFFFSFFVFSLLMCMQMSQSIWKYIPYVNFILYPWRFLSMSIFTASLCAGFFLSRLKITPAYFVYALCIYGIFYFYTPYLHANTTDATDFNRPDFLSHNPAFQNSYYSPALYFPAATKKLPIQQDVPITEAQLLSGKGSIEVLSTSPIQKSYRFNMEKQGIVRFFVHYFAGWHVTSDTKPVSFSSTNAYDYMDVKLPAGRHTIAVSFSDTPIRTLANFISIITFVSLPFVYHKRIRMYVLSKKKSER